MHKKVLKCTTFAMAMMLTVSLVPPSMAFAEVASEETALAGMSAMLEKFYDSSSKSKEEVTTSLLSTPVTIPSNIAICKCDNSINVREKPGTSYNIIGKLPKDAYCIVKSVSDGWAYIESGEVSGYASCDYLIMGEEGYKKAQQLATLTATVTANNVNVRSSASTLTDDNIIAQVTRNEDLLVIEDSAVEVVTKDDPNATIWVNVVIDDLEGYVTKDYVNLSYKWKTASKIDTITTSSLRSTIVSEAKKHIGLRYVWGGTSLSSGADCSGFVWAVYKKCGLSVNRLGLPRTSSDMSKSGKKVSMSTIQPGDLVFYGTSSGKVNHVAMYIGNGKVIHESGRKTGCKISNISYRTVICMRNYLD